VVSALGEIVEEAVALVGHVGVIERMACERSALAGTFGLGERWPRRLGRAAPVTPRPDPCRLRPGPAQTAPAFW
jgi:hypothetical protein